ncbi:MAG TPA: hypothetical protein ENI18_11940 [Candidatus Aminicenantes bacterium]|nr:hypothetical protein [Candidatus Aminicenantes bacterium]
MPNYNFLNFSPAEFEELSRDLLQAELNLRLESFASGRDSGIDLRYSKGKKNLIVQCKRYEKYSDLRTGLKKEAEKIKKLPQQPTRYIITSSVSLTNKNKNEIKAILTPYIKNNSDIYGRDDLNNLLGLHPSIERKHYKLWLSSVNILSRIQHSKIYNQTSFEEDVIFRNIKIYVQNESFKEALEIIKKNKYVIISGIPGIGKTTLARILVYYFLANGFEEFILLSESIGEGYKLYDKNKKQVFFFDDFLGKRNFFKANFANNEDARIINFIKKINESKNKILILATREYILNQAKITFESFEFFSVDTCCIVDLSKYDKLVRSKILYNHLYFSELDKLYITSILERKNYLRIIEHPNYNPRIIESITKEKVWKLIPPKKFFIKFKKFLDYPEGIWKHAYEHQISDLSKIILVILTTTGTPILLEDLLLATQNFIKLHYSKHNIAYSGFEFEKSIKELENCFIISQKDDRNNIIIEFQNPSIQDFLINYLKNKRLLISDIISSAVFLNQLVENFTVDKKKRDKICLYSETLNIFIRQITKDFDYLNFSILHLTISPHPRRERYWRRMPSSDLEKLYQIVIRFDYEKAPQIKKMIIDRLNNFIPENLDSQEIEHYVHLLEKFNKNLSIDKKEMLSSLFDSLNWARDVVEFTKIKNIYPDEYRIFLWIVNLEEKITGIIDEELYQDDLDILEELQYNIADLEESCAMDLSYYSSEIDERIADITDYEGDYPERDYVEPYSNVKDVSDDVIVDMFNSLRN